MIKLLTGAQNSWPEDKVLQRLSHCALALHQTDRFNMNMYVIMILASFILWDTYPGSRGCGWLSRWGGGPAGRPSAPSHGSQWAPRSAWAQCWAGRRTAAWVHRKPWHQATLPSLKERGVWVTRNNCLREQLIRFWPSSYAKTLKQKIPSYRRYNNNCNQLDYGRLWVSG